MPPANSKPCELCGNPVRYDNPTFPYCRHHQHMKNLTSVSQNVNAEEFDEMRENFYNASSDFSHKSNRNDNGEAYQTSIEIYDEVSESLPEFNENLCFSIINKYQESTRDIDMNDSDAAYKNRDRIISDISDSLDEQNISYEVVDCVGGSYISEEKVVNSQDHKVIVIHDQSKTGYSVVVDPATMAPVYGQFKNSYEINEKLGSGSTNFGDGIVIQSLGEYGAYSTVKYDKIMNSNGETLWSNQTSEDKEVENLRKIKSLSNSYVKPVLKKYYTSPKKIKSTDKTRNQKKAPSTGINSTDVLKELLGDDDDFDITESAKNKTQNIINRNSNRTNK